jgi:4-hydroxybutyrate CoA-transferase
MQRLTSLAALAPRLPKPPAFVLHSACGEPTRLARMLAEEAAAFEGGTVYSLMPMGDSPYGDEPASGHLNVVTFFPGKGLRGAVTAGRARTLRHPLSALPGLFDRGEIRADAVLLQVSVPDAQGRVSLGISVDMLHAVLRQRPLVVAEINPQMPATCGDTHFDAALIDFYLDADTAPQPVPVAAADAVDLQIARHVASLIDDGAVLQLGIGSLPDQVYGCLHERRHLGLHTGIVTEAACALIDAGVIDNSTKRVKPGVSVTTMAAGTQPFYDWLHRNALVEFHPCSFTHDAEVLAGIDGLVAVNGALQIDLGGQANAETVAGRVVAAPGGLPDFARGARRSRGGKSILALRSSHKDSSNIVARFAPGTPVSLPAEVIDHVVTEFGIASLCGLSVLQRAEALIRVAHPMHHDALQRELSLWSHS